MVKRIDKLTPEQEARMPEYVERGLKIGLCTDPANRPEAEAGVLLAYKLANLPAPKQIIWVQSPEEGVQLVAKLSGESKSNVVNKAIWGQFDAGWIAWVDYFEEVLELEGLEISQGLRQVGKNAGWWWALDEAAVICERPTQLHLDEQNRLHNESGPVIAYPDGWALYAWHGVNVTEQIIERPETLTPEQILGESNAEVRRVMITKYGADKLLGPKFRVMEDEVGILYKVPLQGDEDITMVELVNSTAEGVWQSGKFQFAEGSHGEPAPYFKHYYLRVPPTIQTAKEGKAWIMGLPEEANAILET